MTLLPSHTKHPTTEEQATKRSLILLQLEAIHAEDLGKRPASRVPKARRFSRCEEEAHEASQNLKKLQPLPKSALNHHGFIRYRSTSACASASCSCRMEGH